MTYYKKKLFLHIPKTGGTSFKRYLMSQWNAPVEYTWSFNKHAILKEFLDTGREVEELYILIRNPYARLVSVYFWCRRLYDEDLCGCKSALDAQEAHNLSFSDWLKNIEKIPVRRAFLPQADFFEGYNNIPTVKVHKLEDLKDKMPHLVKTHHPDWQSMYENQELCDIVYKREKKLFDMGWYKQLVLP